MDAVPDELKGSGGAWFTCANRGPTSDMGCHSWSQAVPVKDGGTYVYGTGVGKTEHYLRSMPALAQRAGRVNRLRDATDRAHAVLDALDEQEAEDSPLVLHIEAQGNCGSVPDYVFDNFLIQCKSCHDYPGTSTDLQECGHLVLPAMTAGAEPGAPWQMLPRYTNRPFVPCSCCGASVLTPEAVAAAQTRKQMPTPAPMGRIGFYAFVFRQLCEAVVPLTVTIRDKQIAQDYRQGLRGFVGRMLDAVGRMVVMVLAALSHLAQATSFLLVMLGTIRHYGRRGESDGHFPLTLRVQPMTPRGAACPAT